jgi:cytochrome b6-f complex iron-sulfur subunit
MAKNKKVVETETSSSRRSFIWSVWLGLGGLALLELVWVAVDFLRPRKARSEADTGTIVIAGPIERFEPGSVTAFPQGKFYLARLPDGGFLALSRECTHLGCTVPWIDEEQRFVCPCHASSFDVRGDVVSPPAPRALDRFAIRIENGIVKIDISKPIKRQSFQITRVTRP